MKPLHVVTAGNNCKIATDQASTPDRNGVPSVPTLLKLPEPSTVITMAPSSHDNYDTTTVLPRFVPPEDAYRTIHRNLVRKHSKSDIEEPNFN